MRFLEKKMEKSFENVGDDFYSEILKKFVKQIEASGSKNILADSIEKYLEMFNIDLIYETEKNNPEIGEMRQKLNTEAGIIISNHPGYLDSPAIMHLIKRKDVKILVSDFKMFSEVLGTENFVMATKNPVELSKQLKIIKEHIKAGGVLLIFPTAGSDSVKNNKEYWPIEFKSGFRYLIDKVLDSEDMVYSFNINADDVSEIINKRDIIGRVEAVNSNVITDINFNKFKERIPIRIKENYSTALEWKQIIKKSSREEVNQALSRHYLEKFEDK